MGKDRVNSIACCGCLLGCLAAIVFTITGLASGWRMRDPRPLLILIPLFGLFCGSIPMTLFSSDRDMRWGAGCLCYSVLGLVSIVSLFDAESRSVAWWGFGFIGLLVLIGSIAGTVRKNNE